MSVYVCSWRESLTDFVFVDSSSSLSYLSTTFFGHSEFDAAALTALALITGREFFAAKKEEEEKKDDNTSAEQ